MNAKNILTVTYLVKTKNKYSNFPRRHLLTDDLDRIRIIYTLTTKIGRFDRTLMMTAEIKFVVNENMHAQMCSNWQHCARTASICIGAFARSILLNNEHTYYYEYRHRLHRGDTPWKNHYEILWTVEIPFQNSSLLRMKKNHSIYVISASLSIICEQQYRRKLTNSISY